MAVKRIWVAGPRSWENVDLVDQVIVKLTAAYGIAGFVVLAGGQTGVDTIVRDRAWEHGVHVAEVKALWDKFNRGAGPYRNNIISALEPHMLIALYWDFDLNPGTHSAVKIARKAKVPVRLVKVDIDRAMQSAKDWKDMKAERAAKRRPKRKVK